MIDARDAILSIFAVFLTLPDKNFKKIICVQENNTLSDSDYRKSDSSVFFADFC